LEQLIILFRKIKTTYIFFLRDIYKCLELKVVVLHVKSAVVPEKLLVPLWRVLVVLLLPLKMPLKMLASPQLPLKMLLLLKAFLLTLRPHLPLLLPLLLLKMPLLPLMPLKPLLLP
jgi:hypothetical protein